MKALIIISQVLIMYGSLTIIGGYMLKVISECRSDLEFFISTCFFLLWIVGAISITLFIKEIKKRL